MKVPLLDLKKQYETIKGEIDLAIQKVVESQQFVLGPAVESCENGIAEYCGVGYACGVSSGTDALLISLMAENIGAGDEVITTPYTFFATGGSIVRTGAKPVFVDIDPHTYNIDPKLIEEKITSKTRAIIPVHLYGQLADIEEIAVIAQKHKLVVIEDAAQAIGAEHNGKRAGAYGHYGCFSFFPSKNLGGFGDGGMVVSDNKDLIDKVKKLRNHGMDPKYYHALVGGNFRLDALQAAVVSVKLKYLDQWTEARQANAAYYDRAFEAKGIASQKMVLPQVVKDRHIFNQYILRVGGGKRDALFEHLKQNGIGCDIYYPVPLHMQECFSDLGYKLGDFPISEAASRETLALPIYPELTDEAQACVVETITNFMA